MFVTQHFSPRWKKEWVPLASQQLRLRNLIQILAFSIKNDKREVIGSKMPNSDENSNLLDESYYFTLHATTMSAPFYTSEKLKSDSPKWKELEMSSWEGNVSSSADAVVIRLWFNNALEPEDKVLSVWGIYLSGLIYLGPNLRKDIPLKPNSLVFLMPGGYFTDPNCIESSVRLRHSSVIVKNCDIRSSYSISALTRLQTLQQVIRKEVAEAEILKKKISMGDFFRGDSRGRTTLRKLLSKHKPKISHTDLVKLKENIEIAKYRVHLLQEEKTIFLNRIEELNKQIESLSHSNEFVSTKILDNYEVLRRQVHNHKEWKKSYIDRREKFLHSKAMLSFRTKQLISELNLIYPIVEVSPEKFTICGVHLPNSEDFAGYDDLKISVALGFVTHVIQMVSIFMQIPLRYPIIHFGSRSRIIDQITDKIPDSEREFCLYIKGKEKLQFHYAVYLLNKNIAQIRWLYGLPTSDLRNTLENLSSLVKMKFVNSSLDQNSRSLSSSTADMCSSSMSVSSPLGSVLSVQNKKNSRVYYLSESGVEYMRNSNSPGHRVSKSVGSSKELMINALSIKNKKLKSAKSNVNNNLSFSLDKGLNEYEEINNGKENDSGQFGSEPSLNAPNKFPKTLHSEAKDKFLKTWNAESQRVPFSDDDSEVHMIDFSTKKHNLSSGSQVTKEDIKDYGECCEEEKSTPEPSPMVFLKNYLPEVKVFETVVCGRNRSDSETEIVKVEPKEKEKSSPTKTVEDDFEKYDDVDTTAIMADTLLENVTSRTEALANQTTCFNRFKSRFKSTLENLNNKSSGNDFYY